MSQIATQTERSGKVMQDKEGKYLTFALGQEEYGLEIRYVTEIIGIQNITSLPDLPVYVMFIPIPIKMKYAAPGMLVILWALSLGLDIPIGNVAHLGGLISGVVYGFYLKNKFPNKTELIRRRFK